MFRRVIIDGIRGFSPGREMWVSRPVKDLPEKVTVDFKAGETGILDMKNPRAVHWADTIDRLEKANRPVYIEIDEESRIITKVLVPRKYKVQFLKPDERGNIDVRLDPSSGVHTLLKSDPNFETNYKALQIARDNNAELYITETRDQHEIIDVKTPEKTSGGPPELPPDPPPDPSVDEVRAQELYTEMKAESCNPCNPSSDCIPFLYPDDGCWARAHKMCKMMFDQGETPEKSWLESPVTYYVPTPNHPDCQVGWGWHVTPILNVNIPGGTSRYAIDPSLSPKAESETDWIQRQGNPVPTARHSAWTEYWGIGTTDPTLSDTNHWLGEYRGELIDRCDDLGPPPYNCTKALFFIIDRNTFSNIEIEAMLQTASPALIESAFYIVLDGFSPDELGFTAPTMQYTPTFNPPPNIPGMTITPITLKFEDDTHLNRRQRLTWIYNISFTNTSGFTSDLVTVTLQASMSTQSATGYLYLIKQPNPYEVDGETSWLSTDLRVFQIKNGESKFGETINNNPSAFITQVISNLNSGTAEGQTFETDISTDQQTSRLELSEKVGGIPVYNFAVAKVRYRSIMMPATNVRVFFRIFTTATTSLEYNQATTYRRYEQGGKVIPLLGITNNEISAIPCFAALRVDSANDSLTTQTDDPNILTIPLDAGGNEVIRYFGCWLDFNQTQPQYPINPSPYDGPFPTNRKSIQELIRNNHQCLVSEIFFSSSVAQNGSTPSTSDKLAQRNLAIVETPNPGAVPSRRIPQTFEIRPSASKLEHDELMIDWGNLPTGSHATIYLPGFNTSEILQIAARKFRSHRFVRIDEHTMKCDTGGMTYIPIPFTEGSFPGLLTVDLPEGIKKGQVFTVIIRQVTGESQRFSEHAVLAKTKSELRHIVGSFQITIPVREKGEILANEERLLSNLRWIERAIPTDNRWAPVFGKYVKQTAERVDAMGGDSKTVAASPSGEWAAAYRKCRLLGLGTALLTTILVVSIGIPAAGLMRFSGIPVGLVLLGIANIWNKECRPDLCQILRNLIAGTVIGFLVLAILAVLGISDPYIVPVLLGCILIAAAMGFFGWRKGCFLLR